MLFDKVLLQTLSTDIWQATTTTYADYSAEVIFLFLHLTLYVQRFAEESVSFVLSDLEQTINFFQVLEERRPE